MGLKLLKKNEFPFHLLTFVKNSLAIAVLRPCYLQKQKPQPEKLDSEPWWDSCTSTSIMLDHRAAEVILAESQEHNDGGENESVTKQENRNLSSPVGGPKELKIAKVPLCWTEDINQSYESH